MSEHVLFTWLDLIGTFAFAVSGAVAAHQKKLDLFGIITLSYVTAGGGGIMRDLCIAIALCFAIRYLSLRFHWNLPRFADND